VLDVALRIDPGDAKALWSRARLLTARAIDSPPAEARTPPSPPPRDDLQRAVRDARRALMRRPTDSATHDTLGRALQALAVRDPANAAIDRAQAIAHLRRAVAMAPDSGYAYGQLATIAASPPRPDIPLALAAAGPA